MQAKRSGVSLNSGSCGNAQGIRSPPTVQPEQQWNALNEHELEELNNWLKSYNMDCERLHRKFSNAVLAAKLINIIFPSCIDVHSYRECFNTQLKKNNWETLNQNILIKLGLPLTANTIDLLAGSTPGAVERFLYDLKKIVDAHENLKKNNDNGEEQHIAQCEEQKSGDGAVHRRQSSVFHEGKSDDYANMGAKSVGPVGDSACRKPDAGDTKCRKTSNAFPGFEEASAFIHPRSSTTDDIMVVNIEGKNGFKRVVTTCKGVFLDRYRSKHRESLKLDERISKAQEILDFCQKQLEIKLALEKRNKKCLLPKLPPADSKKAKYVWVEK